MTPARSQATRGFIVAVGGAEEKIGDVAILRRFATLCGGKNCRVAIIPTASEVAETGSRYEELFHSLGVGRAHVLPIASRADGRLAGGNHDSRHSGPVDRRGADAA